MGNVTDLKCWGRFELVAHLGTGGMGDVYKAYDPNLQRYVALKILRHENPDVVQRFLREAHTQAKVEHRYVVKIHEFGECDGHPYIAMQYIEGKNLNEAAHELNLETKIHIMKNVALGLHAAHSQGLIHRDVKPANIMLSMNEESGWNPYIMDFGIAREQEAKGLTSTGMIVGTPFYMSPEQARGKMNQLDRRSDIYSLGVAMYELFSGQVPFHGETPVEILMAVIEKDPQPLRKLNPRIPHDVETIVMKCLEKDPDRRYNSAKELAEDLQRYLEGDPILARPTTIIYRLTRKARKYKWPFIMTAAAGILILILFGLWLQTRITASQRTEIARELGQEVERIESTIHYAHLLPLHDISKEKKQIRQRISNIEKQMREVGQVAVGPGNYAMGRGFMALQDYEKAKEHLEKAWTLGDRSPEVAYELGRVFGELYLKESEKANRIENKFLQESRKKEIEKTLREPAVNFLRQGGEIKTESKEYIEALIAFYSLKYDNALHILQQAFNQVKDDPPWLYDAKLLEANIYLAIGKEKLNYAESGTFYSKAEEGYRQVIKKGESDIRGYMGLTQILERRLMIESYSKGRDLEPLVNQAVELCRKAIQIDPGMAEIYVTESSVYTWLGRYRMMSGKNPIAAFDQAIKDAKNAIKLQPQNFEAYAKIGSSDSYKAEYQMSRGEDPNYYFNDGVDHFKKAISLNPNFVMAFNGMGNIFVRKAEYEMARGISPDASLNQAIGNFRKALSIEPGLVILHNGLAAAYWNHANASMKRGQDPRPSFLKAVESLENAIKITPGFYHFYNNLGFVYLELGHYELDYGFDPTNTVKKAVEYFEKAIAINPKGNELYQGIVSAIQVQTEYDYLMGRDSSSNVARAYEFYKKGLDINASDVLLHIRMANIFIVNGRFRLKHNQNPSESLSRTEELLKKAIDLNTKYYENYVKMGEVRLLKAGWAIKQSRSPELFFDKALESFEKARNLNSGDIQTHLLSVRLNLEKANWLISNKRNADQWIVQGLKSIEDAIRVNANYGEVYAVKGVLLSLQASVSKDKNTAENLKKEAKTAILKGIGINRNLKVLFAPYI